MSKEVEEIPENDQLAKESFEIDDGEKILLIPSIECRKGLSWQMAILFIVGEGLGGGVVAMSDATVNTGWWSIILIAISLLSNLYITKILAETITIIGEEAHKTRDPYTRAVEYAYGKKAKIFSAFILQLFTICVTTVYLLLCTELFIMFFNEFIPSFTNSFGIRLWLCIIAAILIPVTWFGTPSDYWVLALFAMLTTIVAAVLFSTNLWLNHPSDISKVPVRKVTPISFFFGMGSILFAFCGIPFFPNIQSDMKDGKMVFKSAVISYIIIAAVYIPVGIFGIVLLGDNVNPNIIFNATNLSNCSDKYMKDVLKKLAYTALVLLAGHFLFAYNLIFNTLAQELEELLKIKRVFCWQRCLLRTLLVLITFTLAQTIPKFEIILSLAGGTLMTPLSYHIPCLMYLKLKDNVNMYHKGIMTVVCVIGTIACFGSVYANVIKIFHFYQKPG